MRASARTDVGCVRELNEDSFLCEPELGLFVVADGLGGHAAGEVASREAIDVIHSWLLREFPQGKREALYRAQGADAPHWLRRLLERAVQAATYHVFAIAESDARHSGMGTTISALLLFGERAFFAQVGDSRIYQMRAGNLRQLTDDHTLIAQYLREGLITQEEAAQSDYHNLITRAVGSQDYVEVDTGVASAKPGDLFVLCTDGLHNYLEPQELLSYSELRPEDATLSLINLARERGGKDNITTVVVAL